MTKPALATAPEPELFLREDNTAMFDLEAMEKAGCSEVSLGLMRKFNAFIGESVDGVMAGKVMSSEITESGLNAQSPVVAYIRGFYPKTK